MSGEEEASSYVKTDSLSWRSCLRTLANSLPLIGEGLIQSYASLSDHVI